MWTRLAVLADMPSLCIILLALVMWYVMPCILRTRSLSCGGVMMLPASDIVSSMSSSLTFGGLPLLGRSRRVSMPPSRKRSTQKETQLGHCMSESAACWMLSLFMHTMFTAAILILTLGSLSFLYAFFRSSDFIAGIVMRSGT